MIDNPTLRLRQYEDVKTVLDEAVASKGVEYVLPTATKAAEWRHRAYRFRSLLYEVTGERPYDDITIRLPKEKPGTCVIETGPRRIEGKLVKPSPEDEDLLDFVKGLGRA